MATTNYNLPTISGASPVAIVDDYNALANSTDAALAGAISGEKTRAMAAETELANGVSNALTTANTANVSATNAQTAADKAQTTASTALTNAATAQTTADGAKSAADAAQASADAACAIKLTRITNANATNNGVVNFTSASTIGTGDTDGLEVVETEHFIYIEGRGIATETGGIHQLAQIVPELLHALGYVPCTVGYPRTTDTEISVQRSSSDGNVYLCGRSETTQTRVSFTVLLAKPATA